MTTLDPAAAPIGFSTPVAAAAARQPWIASPGYDTALIIMPGLIAMLISCLMPPMGVGAWIALVAIVDTAHVYATLFRTYLDREEMARRRHVFLIIPAACLAAGYWLYAFDPLWFWRAIIYLALFHFTRQQYGFMMIYGRFERGLPDWCRRIDKLAIYVALLHPLVTWHFAMQTNFHWFQTGDFLAVHPPQWVVWLCHGLAAAVLGAWAGKELWLRRRGHAFNRPRALLLVSTMSIGLAALHSDLAFAATLFLFHAIPYIGLTFLFERKREAAGRSQLPGLFKRLAPAIIGFIGLLMLMTFIEEGLWDALVWREHALLPGFGWLEAMVADPPLWLLVPLLSLPQTTHYVLDAVIWRRDLAGSDWAKILFARPEGGSTP